MKDNIRPPLPDNRIGEVAPVSAVIERLMNQQAYAGIPTVYAGIQMRSRLEARWAAFFDQCGWQWTYEAVDLPGWIPDFLLRETLVEIKPFTTFAEFTDAIVKAEAAMRQAQSFRELLLLGTSPWSEEGDVFIGWLGERVPGLGELDFARAPFGLGWKSDRFDFCHERGNWHLRIYGGTGSWPEPHCELTQLMWANACNATQWRAPQ